MDGYGNSLPWDIRVRKLFLLFKMCKKTEKCLFAGGMGMGMLVHYTSVGLKNIEVFNGGGKGGILDDMGLIDKEWAHELTRNEVFLDYNSGDFFYFNPDSRVWMPAGNVGLHSLHDPDPH